MTRLTSWTQGLKTQNLKLIHTSFVVITLLMFGACSQKPPHHPKHPNYAVKKPKVIYKPSKKNLNKMVKKLQGSPYVWAEEGPNNFDCSGFTYYMYGSMGVEIPRVAREQAKNGCEIKMRELVYGDLIFFDTEKKRKGNITHVGMYLGNGWFTHASTTNHEVIYSNLNASTYYKQRLRICRRYLPDEKQKIARKSVSPWKAKEITRANVPVVEPVAQTVQASPRTRIPNNAGHYYVQVGSFSGKPKNDLLQKILSAGYHYKIIGFPMNGKEISKLLIGPYREKSQALEVLPTVKSEIQKEAFIAEIR